MFSLFGGVWEWLQACSARRPQGAAGFLLSPELQEGKCFPECFLFLGAVRENNEAICFVCIWGLQTDAPAIKHQQPEPASWLHLTKLILTTASSRGSRVGCSLPDSLTSTPAFPGNKLARWCGARNSSDTAHRSSVARGLGASHPPVTSQ